MAAKQTDEESPYLPISDTLLEKKKVTFQTKFPHMKSVYTNLLLSLLIRLLAALPYPAGEGL